MYFKIFLRDPAEAWRSGFGGERRKKRSGVKPAHRAGFTQRSFFRRRQAENMPPGCVRGFVQWFLKRPRPRWGGKNQERLE